LQLLSRGLGDDVQPRLPSGLGLGEVQARLAAAEEPGEDPLEALVHHLESAGEPFPAGAVDAGDRLAQRLEAGLEVGLLTGEEAVPLGHLLVLLDGGEVDLPHPLQLAPELAERLLLGGLEEGPKVEARQLVLQIRLVSLLHRGEQMLEVEDQRTLPEGDLSQALGEPVEPGALLAEAGLVGPHLGRPLAVPAPP
jgi:hypothetical protein